MGQDTTKAVIITSVLGTVRIFVVLLAGFSASKWPKNEPLLTRETCRRASRICALLFLPALTIASMGATLNPAALLESWQLVAASTFTIAISGMVAWVFGRVLLRPEARRAFHQVHLAIMFPNCVPFPLLLLETLCEHDDINSDFDDAAECFSRATGMIFIYVVVWQIWFFGWGFYALGSDDALEVKLTGEPSRSPRTTAVGGTSAPESPDVFTRTEGDSNGSMDEMAENGIVAFDVELDRNSVVPPAIGACGHLATEGDKTRGVGSVEDSAGVQSMAVYTAENPQGSEDHIVVPVLTNTAQGESPRGGEGSIPSRWRWNKKRSRTVVAPNVAEDNVAEDNGDEQSVWKRRGRRLLIVLVSPNIITVAIGVVIAMIAPLKEMLFENPQAALRPLGAAMETVGTPVVAVSTLVMAGSLVQVPMMGTPATLGGESDSAVQAWRRFRFIVGALHVGCRLIAVPAVGFAVFWVAKARSSIMGENRLMHLVLLVELAMPSASFIIVSLNQIRMPATAGFMARLYIWHYGVSMFTISFWTALAVRMVY